MYQCSRPPPAHSKDLHSAIVAAFQCISIWLTEHGDLLLDRECLISILEVIELGISGSKSVNVSTETVKYKDGKELKPVSMRVRDAAESILTIIMEQIDPLNVDAMTQGMSSQLNEVMLMKCCNVNSKNLDQQGALNNFKYYVTENSTMLALLDEPLGNSENLQPTVTGNITLYYLTGFGNVKLYFICSFDKKSFWSARMDNAASFSASQ